MPEDGRLAPRPGPRRSVVGRRRHLEQAVVGDPPGRESAGPGRRDDRRPTADEQRLRPDLGPGRVGPLDGHGSKPAVGRLAGPGVEQVMDGPAVPDPRAQPHRRGGDRPVLDRDGGERIRPTGRVLDADQPRAVFGPRSAGDEVSAGLEQEAARRRGARGWPRPSGGPGPCRCRRGRSAASTVQLAGSQARGDRSPTGMAAPAVPVASSGAPGYPSRSRSRSTRGSKRPSVTRCARSAATSARSSRRGTWLGSRYRPSG